MGFCASWVRVFMLLGLGCLGGSGGLGWSEEWHVQTPRQQTGERDKQMISTLVIPTLARPGELMTGLSGRWR